MSKTPLKKIRFMGLSLGGGKTHRTHLAVLDYFTENDKLFLTHLYRDLGEEDRKSADTHLLEVIRNNSENLQSITVDYPLTTPKCMRCRLVCPGVEKCHEPEIQWMWNQHEMLDEKNDRTKFLLPIQNVVWSSMYLIIVKFLFRWITLLAATKLLFMRVEYF